MAHQGDASRTKLEAVKIIAKGDKSSVAITLSGKPLDRAAALTALKAAFPDDQFPNDKFPGKFIEPDGKGDTLTIAVSPVSDQKKPAVTGLYLVGATPDTSKQESADTAKKIPTVTDIVEKVFDATKCDLGFHCQATTNIVGKERLFSPEMAKQYQIDRSGEEIAFKHAADHGSQYVPEVVISSDRTDDNNSDLRRTVMDVIERKLQRDPNDDLMANYLCTRPGDGSTICVTHLKEVRDNKEETILLANDMAAHCKQRLGVPSADIRMTGMEGEVVPITSEPTEYRPPEPMVITLSGSAEALARTQLKLDDVIGLEMELIPGRRGQSPQLRISKAAQSEEDAIAFVKQIHMDTGCELPVRLLDGVQIDQPDTPQGKPTYQPATLAFFDDEGIQYSGLLVRAVSQYILSHVKGKCELQFPNVQGADGESMYDLDKPVAFIHEKKYNGREDADNAAREMVARLKPLLQFNAKPASQERQ